MNKYIRASVCLLNASIKHILLKIARGKNLKWKMPSLVSPLTEITVDRGGRLILGKMFRMRSSSKLRVRKNAIVKIGKNFSMSNSCMIVSWDSICIGDDVQFGPGVFVYDHDHEYDAPEGLSGEKYKTSPIIIGDGVWIGANSIILRGSEIGDGCVVAAGTVIRGKYPANTLIYENREVKEKLIVRPKFK